MENFLNANWENLVMANYAVPEKVLMPYLPKGCELDLYQGTAYVSLVGFMFKNTRLFQVPVPLLGTFEEINLRFYVTRNEGGRIKRGVVFINETVPYKAVAWIANKLYREHYTSVPTKNAIVVNKTSKLINYQWKLNGTWNNLYVEASAKKHAMAEGSFEEFIFEHYYGYTRIDANKTEEYKISHPRWDLNEINKYEVNCAFDKMYGRDFSFLNSDQPVSVFLAEGSSVSVNWKRKRLKLNAA